MALNAIIINAGNIFYFLICLIITATQLFMLGPYQFIILNNLLNYVEFSKSNL